MSAVGLSDMECHRRWVDAGRRRRFGRWPRFPKDIPMKIHLFPVIAAALALSGCGKGETPPEPAAGEGAMAAAIGGDASAMRATSTIAANLAASPIPRTLTDTKWTSSNS